MAKPAPDVYGTFGGAGSCQKGEDRRARIEKAAYYALQASDGFERAPVLDTPSARAGFRTHCKNLWLTQFCAWALVLLTFFEEPIWCREVASSDGSMVHPCYKQVYPSFPIRYFSSRTQLCLQIVPVLVIFFDLAQLAQARGMGVTRGTGGPVMLAMSLLVCDTLIALESVNRYFRLRPYLRIFIAAKYSRSVLAKLSLVVRSMTAVFHVFALGGLFLTFFSCMAVMLFAGTAQSEQLFPDVGNTVWQLFILTTTANYPDVMMPGYTENRLYFLFFLLFCTLMIFFMVPVLTATIFTTYSNIHAENRAAQKKVRKDSVSAAWSLLAENGAVPVDVVTEFLDEVAIYLGKPRNAFTFNPHPDKDGDGLAEWSDFKQLMKSLAASGTKETAFELRFPSVLASPAWRALKDLVVSKGFEASVGVFVFVTATNYAALKDDFTRRVELFSACILFSVEGAVKTALFGLENLHKVDLLVLAIMVPSMPFILRPASGQTSSAEGFAFSSEPGFIQFVGALRLFRLLKFFYWVPRFRRIIDRLVRVFPEAIEMGQVLFVAMFFFSSVGTHCFGGKINTDPNSSEYEALKQSEYGQANYYVNNFNDQFSGFVVLFELMVLNNWFVIVDGFTVTCGKWSWIYFVAFWVCGVVLFLNIVVSVIIDAFTSVEEVEDEPEEPSAQDEGKP